jgi:hypothetical protein
MKSGPENGEYGRGEPLHWPRDTLYPQKLALTSPISGDRPVGIVRSRTNATEFSFVFSSMKYLRHILTGIVGSNPSRGIDVCLVFVFPCVELSVISRTGASVRTAFAVARCNDKWQWLSYLESQSTQFHAAGCIYWFLYVPLFGVQFGVVQVWQRCSLFFMLNVMTRLQILNVNSFLCFLASSSVSHTLFPSLYLFLY